VFRIRGGVSALLQGLAVSVLVFLIGGCATKQPSQACVEVPNSVECLCATEPESIECACATDPGSAKCLCGRDASSRACACAKDPGARDCAKRGCPKGSAASLTAKALREIDDGNWRMGRRLIDCALKRSPNSAMARSVLEQLKTEPASYFRSKFGAGAVTYVVQVNDSLSKIAEACLGDRDYFVALARLNDIEVPRGLAYGQRIRVPGDRCEPMPDTEPERDASREYDSEPPPSPITGTEETDQLTMALEAEQSGDLSSAYEFAKAALDSDPLNTDVGTAFRRIKADYVNALASTAYEQDDGGDLEGAIATWDRVLEIDKYNAEARMMHRVLTEEVDNKN